jgi:uncharacterized protein (DUF433 family)
MAAMPQVQYPHIVRDPRVHGGEPVVAGTRIPVRAVVVAWEEYGDVATMLEAYPRLTEVTLDEALAYYRANQIEMDEIIREQLADA